MKVGAQILNSLHLLLLFIPIIIFFISKSFIKPYAKWILLFNIMIPLQWTVFDNKCILTEWSKNLGDYTDISESSNSSFTRSNLKFIYFPIMKKLGLKWNETDINKMVYIHWFLNSLLLWIYSFYYNK